MQFFGLGFPRTSSFFEMISETFLLVKVFVASRTREEFRTPGPSVARTIIILEWQKQSVKGPFKLE